MNMYKYLPIFLIAFLQASPFSLSIGVGGFFPECDHVRSIYGSKPIFQVEGDYALVDNLAVFGNVSFLWASGETMACKDTSSLELMPLSLGLLVTTKTAPIQWYVGGGPAYSFLWVQDHSPHVESFISNHRLGAVLKSGMIVWKGNLFVQLYGDILFQKFRFKTSDPTLECHHVNFNAFIIGVAFGKRV